MIVLLILTGKAKIQDSYYSGIMEDSSLGLWIQSMLRTTSSHFVLVLDMAL